MSAWNVYASRINAQGRNRHDTAHIREARYITRKLPDNLSYFVVDIYPPDYGYNIDKMESHIVKQELSIVSTDNYETKKICTLPQEDIQTGSLIHWMDSYWLVEQKDYNDLVYTKATITQCNHLLKWITPEHEIIEQWCIVGDGTKYLIGTYEDKDFFTTRGDARMSLDLAKNKITVTLDRSYRFLIDDPDSPKKCAYALTKPLKRGLTYNDEGIFSFTLHEAEYTDDDNHELGIADYYRHFNKASNEIILDPDPRELDEPEPPVTERKEWL